MPSSTPLQRRGCRILPWVTALVVLGLQAATASSAAYPPIIPPPDPDAPQFEGVPRPDGGPIFVGVHNYGDILIRVEIYNNYLGDFTKYHWVYRVTNFTYNPAPGNGFSGFELALPAFVPDIADISAPDGIPPWVVNCCSGLPVEWDLRYTDGLPVGGGTLPGQTEVFSFTTLPRLITLSTGWFHSWDPGNVQFFIVNYPAGNQPECPDVLSDPGRELCCTQSPQRGASGAYVCEVLPAGQCEQQGGEVVPDCAHCPPITPTVPKTWGKVKDTYRQ